MIAMASLACTALLVVGLIWPVLTPGSPASGRIRTSAVGDLAYTLLAERVRANQSQFFLYNDADSGLNHGFVSGVFGNPPVVQINPACIDAAVPTGCSTDPSVLDRVRGTVLSLTFGPRSAGQFHGVTIQEPLNGATGPGVVGYDLSGATAVTFDVRSPQGIRVQFAVHGSESQFVTIPTNWTTLTLPFNALSPPLSNVSGVRSLFTVVTNVENAPGGGVLLLDNIRLEPVPAAQSTRLGLPLSTQTFGVNPVSGGEPPPDQINRNPAAIYEAALTILALLDRGTAEDRADARQIADALSYALRHENDGDPLPLASDGSAGLHNAYEAGDLALLNGQGLGPNVAQTGDVRLAGFSITTPGCGISGFCLVLDGATGGNNAFVILALLAAADRLNQPMYRDDALTIGRWIEGRLRDGSASSYGGYFLGYEDKGVIPKPLQLGKSVENNADIFAAFTALAGAERARGNTAAANVWTERANWAGDFVMRMYDAPTGRFNAGTAPFGSSNGPGVLLDPSHRIGNDVLNIYAFLDADTFVTLALAAAPRYRSQIDWRRPVQHARATFAQSVSAGGQTYSGYSLVTSPESGPNGVAWEFTGQMVVTMQVVDALYGETAFAADIAALLAQIQKAQTTAPFGDGRGVVAATLPNGDVLPPANQCLKTPFQCIPERVGLAATTWAIFADRAINPLATSGFAVGCVTRPNIGLSVTSGGAGAVNATLTARPSAPVPGNLLRDSVRFTGGANATLEIDGQVRALPYTAVLPAAGVPQFNFTVRRVTFGQAFRLDVTARDTCGDWRTFVGAGTGLP